MTESGECSNCKEWGKTITEEDCFPYPAIPCSVCKRLTYPNLGVNLPAGCAVALASGASMNYLMRIKPYLLESQITLYEGLK